MDTGWASYRYYACSVPRATYGETGMVLSWFYGLPGSAQSIPFCSPGMAVADASVAGGTIGSGSRT